MKEIPMKKLISLAFIFTAVAALGITLRSAANDESSSPNNAADTGMPGESVVATGAGSELQCPVGNAGPCRGMCISDTTAATNPPLNGAGKPCGMCQQECRRCAEVREESATDQTDMTTENRPGMGRGMGRGRMGDPQHAKDHQDFFYLIEHRDDTRRTVKNISNGVETLTVSDVKDVATMIKTHVEAMYDRMEHANPIRMRDPIFREVFANAKKIKLKIEHTDHGVRVKETSDDAYAVKLVQEHAKVVSLWIKNGYAELPKNHAAPKP